VAEIFLEVKKNVSNSKAIKWRSTEQLHPHQRLPTSVIVSVLGLFAKKCVETTGLFNCWVHFMTAKKTNKTKNTTAE